MSLYIEKAKELLEKLNGYFYWSSNEKNYQLSTNIINITNNFPTDEKIKCAFCHTIIKKFDHILIGIDNILYCYLIGNFVLEKTANLECGNVICKKCSCGLKYVIIGSLYSVIEN